MNAIFISIFNMSFTASIAAVAVILIRMMLKKAPKWINVALWSIVAIRLILPISFESVLSIIPSNEPLPSEIITDNSFNVNTGIAAIDRPVNDYLDSHYYEGVTVPAESGASLMEILSVIWLCGIAAMLIYAVASYICMRLKVREAVKSKGNIYYCDSVGSPFILGIILPKIYLPSNISDTDAEYVIKHENAHIKRLDHIIKPFGFLLLSVYWFNPILWLAYMLLCRDIELACDERVINQANGDIKVPYSEALISCALPRRSIAACPLAFGEVGVKPRIKNVLSYKKPAFWIIIAAVIAIIISSVCLLTNPARTKIANIEKMSLDTAHETAYTIYLTTEENVYSSEPAALDRELIKEILQLEVSRYPVSLDRSEYRIAPNRVVLEDERTDTQAMLSRLLGNQICFNDDFTEVFINNDVKPTLSYKVINPKQAKRLFNELQGKIDDYRLTHTQIYAQQGYGYVKRGTDGKIIKKSQLTLDKANGTYQLLFSYFSSTILSGSYVETDEKIILLAENDTKYTFNKSGENLIFDADSSSQVPKYKYSGTGQPEPCIEDGAIFNYPTKPAYIVTGE